MKFEVFLSKVNPLLEELNCDFGYQRVNCKKNGHFKKKTRNGIISYEIKIEKLDNDAGKIYTLSHELAHAYNKHLDLKELTYPQKEYVADQVGKLIIDYLNMQKELKKSTICQKFNLDSYSINWMKKRQISAKKVAIMDEQVVYTVKKLLELLEF